MINDLELAGLIEAITIPLPALLQISDNMWLFLAISKIRYVNYVYAMYTHSHAQNASCMLRFTD